MRRSFELLGSGSPLALLLAAPVALTAQLPGPPPPLRADTAWTAPTATPARAYRIESAVLGETRRVFVRTPASFERTTRTYPLVVVLDGEALTEPAALAAEALARAGHAPEAVVVGVENTDRLRDLSPPGLPVSGNDGRGRADRFLDFLDQELCPALARDFRAGEPYVLVGHSSGGIFALYAAAERPEDVRWVLALDGPTHLGDEALVHRLVERTRSPTSPLRLVSLEARFGWTEEAWARLVGSAPASWRLHRAEVPGESHETMAVPGMYLGLKALFGDYSTVTAAGTTAAEKLRAYERLSDWYGELPAPRRLMREAIEDLTIRQRAQEALDLLDRMIAGHGPHPGDDELRSRISAARADEPLDETLEELQSIPLASADEIGPFVGRWEGHTWNEGDSHRNRLTLLLRAENGRAAGRVDHGNGPDMELEFIEVGHDGRVRVGYMNRMRPRGLLLYDGTVSGDVFEGRFVLAGVVFTLPDGRPLPTTHFRFERVR